MENLELYNKIRTVPKEAQREIQAGRLRGKTDINPMWRIKMLTEQFGICGFGWKYIITKQWTESGGQGEISAFVNIDLFIKNEKGEWSDAIQGTGGSSFVALEKNGLYTSDECYKMALTDAISVACKALGMGADVYWNKDNTKYTAKQEVKPVSPKPPFPTKEADPKKWAEVVKALAVGTIENSKGEAVSFTLETVSKKYNLTNEIKQQLMDEVLTYE